MNIGQTKIHPAGLSAWTPLMRKRIAADTDPIPGIPGAPDDPPFPRVDAPVKPSKKEAPAPEPETDAQPSSSRQFAMRNRASH